MVVWKADIIIGVVIGIYFNFFITITSSSPEYLGVDVFGFRIFIILLGIVWAFVISLLFEIVWQLGVYLIKRILK